MTEAWYEFWHHIARVAERIARLGHRHRHRLRRVTLRVVPRRGCG